MSRYLQDAVVTAVGYADPLTGELLKTKTGLPDPVPYYKPNARNSAFDDENTLIMFKRFPPSKTVRFALHTPRNDITRIDWDFGDTDELANAGRRVTKTYAAAGTYTVEATVTFTPPTGSVIGFSITEQGTGYTVAPTITLSAPQTPGGVTATATAEVNGGGQVNNIIITNPGSGYTSPPTVTFTPAPGDTEAAGAEAEALLDEGDTSTVSVEIEVE